MKDCIFCQIIEGKIPANLVYSDDQVIAFDDIHPKAPQHKLIIPRVHIPTLNDITEGETALAGRLLYTAQYLAKQSGIAESGYRVVMNCNADGGQLIYHVHLHLLGGRPMNDLSG